MRSESPVVQALRTAPVFESLPDAYRLKCAAACRGICNTSAVGDSQTTNVQTFR